MSKLSFHYFSQETLPTESYLAWMNSSETERTQLLPLIESAARLAEQYYHFEVDEIDEDEILAAIRALRVFVVTEDDRAIAHALKLEIYLDSDEFEELTDIVGVYLGELSRQNHFELMFKAWLEFRQNGGEDDESILGLIGRHCTLNDQLRSRIREHILHHTGFMKGLALPDVYDHEIFLAVQTRLKELAPLVLYFSHIAGRELSDEWQELTDYWAALKLDKNALVRTNPWSEERKRNYLMREVMTQEEFDQEIELVMEKFRNESPVDQSKEEEIVEETFFSSLPDRPEDWLASPVHTAFQSQFLDSIASHNSKKKLGRNDPCPCGSGKKYKKCCAN